MLGYYKLRKKIKELLLDNKIQENNFNFQKKGDVLYLFGNGYTLKNFDLNTIVNQDCFICNAFFRIPNFNEFIEQNNILDFALDSFSFSKSTSKKINIPFETFLEEYENPKIGMGFPLVRTFDFFPYILNKNPNQTIITTNALLKKYISLNNKTQIFNIYNKIGHTPQFMVLIGILMGYKKIFLYGLEHNYVKDILNKSDLCGTHFYDDTYEDVLLGDGNKRDRESAKIKLSKLFEGNAIIFKGYEQLADLSKELGVEIIDHSNGSLFMFQDYSLWDLVEENNRI